MESGWKALIIWTGMHVWKVNFLENLYFSTSCKLLHFTWIELESWKPNHWTSGSSLGNDVSRKFCSQALQKKTFRRVRFYSRMELLHQKDPTDKWVVSSSGRVLRVAVMQRQSNVSVGENSAKPQFVAWNDAFFFSVLQGSAEVF